MKFILKKKDGYILAWVLCIFIIVAVISTIVISSAIISTKSTTIQHKTQQAYFTAKSAAASVADYILENSSDTSVIDNLIANPGSGSIPNMGDYTVEVSYVTTSKIKVKATASYNGETATVSANLIKLPSPSGIIPTDNVVFVNGSAGSGIGQAILYGDVYVDGNFTLDQNSAITGFIVSKGTTTISGSGCTASGIFSYGNVMLSNGKVDGDVFTKGDLTISSSAYINGNAFSDGSLVMDSGRIEGNAVIKNNASFKSNARINGTLTYGGTLSPSNVSAYVSEGATPSSSYTDIDASPYNAQALPIVIPPPSLFQAPEVPIYNRTISDSGIITPADVNIINQGGTVTINARTKDISLLLNNTSLNLTNGTNIEVDSDGTHNVFIYMTGSSSISVNSNEYIGMKVRSTNPRIFIFGDGEQTVNLNNKSELDACVYIPDGTFNASGSPLTTYKFVGSCIVRNVNLSSKVTLYHSKPDIEGTPLDVFVKGETGSTKNAWKLESWVND